MTLYPRECVRSLISAILFEAVFEARKGCKESRAWLKSERALMWASYLDIDRSAWLAQVGKLQPVKPVRRKPKACQPVASDTPLVSALSALAQGKRARAPLPTRDN